MRFCNYTKIKFGIYFTWQWGWGLEQPIAAPLFSKIWTHLEDTIGNWNTICVCLYVRSLFDCYKQVFTTQARLNMIRPNLIENICRRRRRPPTCTSGPRWSSPPPRCRWPPWSPVGSSGAGSRWTWGWNTSPCMSLVLRQTWESCFFTFATRFKIIITLEKKKHTHLKRGSPVSSGSGTSSSSAGKSLLKTNVVSYLNNPLSWCCQTHVSSVYFGLVSPLGRVTPGQRGFVGSNSGLSSSVTFSTWW